MLGDFMVGAMASALTGLVLWALLPRGVVLTRRVRTHDPAGRLLYDTWEITNDSALSIRITSVAVKSLATYDEDRDGMRWLELSPRTDLGVDLMFDDDILDVRRSDNRQSWRGQDVPPGDTLQATVTNNTTVRIKYRRPGAFGIFERREISIHGYA